MNKKQQMQDLLKDTVDYYSEDPNGRRSITDDGDCMYTWGKNHCAVGRYLREEYQDETWEDNNRSVNELAENADDGEWNIDWCLVDKAQGLDVLFWCDLQDMHDAMSYWEEWCKDTDGQQIKQIRKYGLTDRGKERYVALQDRIASGEYDD